MTNNIISFPTEKIVNEMAARNSAFVFEMQDKAKNNFIDNLANGIATEILRDLESNGLELKKEVLEKDFVFLVTVLRSLIFRLMEMEHPMHQFIDVEVNTKIAMIDSE